MHLGQVLFIAGEEICISNGIDEEELVEVWMAFSVSHLRGADPTVDALVQMERKEFGKKQELQPQPHRQPRSLENSLIIYSGKEPAYPLYAVFDSICTVSNCRIGIQGFCVELSYFILFFRLEGRCRHFRH